MASVELGKPSYEAMSQGETRARLENGKREETDLNDTRNGMKKNGNRTVSSSLPMLGCGCFRVQRDEEGNLDIDVVNGSGERPQPTHLLIMVNGLFGRLLHFPLRFFWLLL